MEGLDLVLLHILVLGQGTLEVHHVMYLDTVYENNYVHII